MKKSVIILSWLAMLMASCTTQRNEKNEIGYCLNKIFNKTVEFDLISKNIIEEEIIIGLKQENYWIQLFVQNPQIISFVKLLGEHSYI